MRTDTIMPQSFASFVQGSQGMDRAGSPSPLSARIIIIIAWFSDSTLYDIRAVFLYALDGILCYICAFSLYVLDSDGMFARISSWSSVHLSLFDHDKIDGGVCPDRF